MLNSFSDDENDDSLEDTESSTSTLNHGQTFDKTNVPEFSISLPADHDHSQFGLLPMIKGAGETGSVLEYLPSSGETAATDDDAADKYWKSDHHKFEWPDLDVQQRAPLSWHALGLPVQDSFVSKGIVAWLHTNLNLYTCTGI